MSIALSPLDYYFYRRQLYTIQLIFEFNQRLNFQRVREGLDRILEQMPVVGSRPYHQSAPVKPQNIEPDLYLLVN